MKRAIFSLLAVVLCVVNLAFSAPINLCGAVVNFSVAENPPACNSLTMSPGVGEVAEWAKTVVAPVNATGIDGFWGKNSDSSATVFLTFAGPGPAFQQVSYAVVPDSPFHLDFSAEVLAEVGNGSPFNIDFFWFRPSAVVVTGLDVFDVVGQVVVENVAFTTPRAISAPATVLLVLSGTVFLIGIRLHRLRLA